MRFTRVVNAMEILVGVVNIITVALEGVSIVLYGENEQPQWVSIVDSTLQIAVLFGEWQKVLRLLIHYGA